MNDRRAFLQWMAAAGAGAFALACGRRASTGATDAAPDWFPEKAADLTLHTDRPPNLETPLRYFAQDLTPNDAFFVRWHTPVLPARVDLRAFRLTIGGHVDRPLSLSVDDLKRRDAVSIVAVNQCSGNSRGLFEPRVPGVQWSNGALGNAKWTGVRLRDLLRDARLKAAAVDVTFAGLDEPQLAATPKFAKSLGVDRASDPDVLVAYAMNDAPLPMLNGFPLRLVVPGWYSTYWVKSLAWIEVLPTVFDGYWMKKAYRVPKTPGANESPGDLAKETVPISSLNVRSLVVRPAVDSHLVVGRSYDLEGIAFDGGTGIEKVDVSTDGGATWQPATLDANLGKYSFRRWRAAWTPTSPGPASVMARATTRGGETQPLARNWNRAGYMRNVVERVDVMVTA